jgi:hypothetical protein
MKTSIWHHNADRQPDKSGYYLAYKSYSMGDDSTSAGYYYYSKTSGTWRDSSLHSAHYANVYYWTDATPDDWVDNDQVRVHRQTISNNPTLNSAWQDVLAAIEKFKIIEALVKQA